MYTQLGLTSFNLGVSHLNLGACLFGSYAVSYACLQVRTYIFPNSLAEQGGKTSEYVGATSDVQARHHAMMPSTL